METLDTLLAQAKSEVEGADSTATLEAVATRYLGRKGLFAALFQQIGKLPPAERPAFGQRVNESRAQVESWIAEKRAHLERLEQRRKLESERLDITLPGLTPRPALRHPLTIVSDRVKQVLIGLGFEFVEGPELEHYHYNFEALNYPEDHPAMDEQNSFYVDDQYLLRTQTTAIQGRIFEKRQPPMRIAIIGRCFRYENVDATHWHTFHQVDAFMVDKGVSMAQLKGTLAQFARQMFGPQVQIRFRPDFFPFVEPGVDYALSCFFCGGEGCSLCKGSGWIELGGAGLIHPNILKHYGIDTEQYSGFAFGLGIERILMLQYGVDHIRLFLENDLRFLRQFQVVG